MSLFLSSLVDFFCAHRDQVNKNYSSIFLVTWTQIAHLSQFLGIEETQSQMLYWQIELVVPSKTIVALIGMQQINLVVVSGDTYHLRSL